MAITAITAQNTLGVQGVHPVPADMVLAQIDSVASDIGVDAVKSGMLHAPEVVDALLGPEQVSQLLERARTSRGLPHALRARERLTGWLAASETDAANHP